MNKIIGLVANAPLKNQTFYESSSSPSDAIWSPEISSDTSLVQLFKKPKPAKVDDYNIIQGKVSFPIFASTYTAIRLYFELLTDLWSRIDTELQLGLLAIVDGQPLHEKGGEP